MSPRLKNFPYLGYYAYAVTICTFDRQTWFTDGETVVKCLDVLRQLCQDYRMQILAYCFMPDHVHLLVAGMDDRADVKAFMHMFKQKSGYWFKQANKMRLWQPGYYERVVRQEENIKDIVRYFWGNPVRKGLVADYRQYPYSGSDVFGLEEL